jgi:hypothetical protein
MSNFEFRDNPYQTPGIPPQMSKGPPPTAKIVAPAIALIVVATLGLGCSIFNVIFSFQPAEVDLNAPPFVQEMQRNSAGATATIIQSVFVLVNLGIIGGAVMMARVQNWALAMTATILAMLNFGSCCCILGIPFGIWSLIVLVQPDVKDAFARNASVH